MLKCLEYPSLKFVQCLKRYHLFRWYLFWYSKVFSGNMRYFFPLKRSTSFSNKNTISTKQNVGKCVDFAWFSFIIIKWWRMFWDLYSTTLCFLLPQHLVQLYFFWERDTNCLSMGVPSIWKFIGLSKHRGSKITLHFAIN